MNELELLKHAVSVIKIWHGESAFDIYYNNAPEMKPIRDRIFELTNICEMIGNIYNLTEPSDALDAQKDGRK